MINRFMFAILLVGIFTVLAADTIPGGDVSGTWYAANSPYYITGNITIPNNDTLIIEPGVLVNFLGDYSLTANGVLEAVGTESDSIHFFPEDTLTGWSGITCHDNFNSLTYLLSYNTISHAAVGYDEGAGWGSALISHCRFSSNTMGISWAPWGGAAALQVSDCIFRDNGPTTLGAALSLNSSNGPVDITRCLFENNMVTEGGGAIHAISWSDSVITIIDCTFLDNYAGIYGGAICVREVYSPVVVEQCTFEGNNAVGTNHDEGGGAIWGTGVSNFDISYCCFYDNYALYGSSINGSPMWGDNHIDIDHCTFLGEVCADDVSNSTLDISTCIFAYSQFHAILNYPGVLLTVEYSDFYDNFNLINNPPAGFGVLDRVNYNGDSCDCYYNIFMDPMFVDTLNRNFHLLATSPCIDAGDTTYPLDPDGTITDMGAYWFDQTGVVEYSVDKHINEYDFLGATIFSGPLLLPESKTCKVFDITGRVVIPQQIKPGVYFIVIDGKIKQKAVKIK